MHPPVVPMSDFRSQWRRLVERILPWYDRDAEDARNRRTETIRRQAIAARIEAERVREAYRVAGKRMTR